VPTRNGIQLIDTIQNDLVKSAELTGSGKAVKDIEKERYRCCVYQHETNGRSFIHEVEETTRANISHAEVSKKEVVKVEKKASEF
jgi:DNA topoisomerase-3